MADTEQELEKFGLVANVPTAPVEDAFANPTGEPVGQSGWHRITDEPEPEAPSTTETLGAAFRQSNVTLQIVDGIDKSLRDEQEYDTTIDTNYDFNTEGAHLLDGVPQEFHGDIIRQPSLRSAEQARADIEQDLRDQDTLNRAGGYGTAASVVAALLSVENFIPLAGAASAVSKAGRLKSALTVGAQIGVVEASAEAIRAESVYTNDGENILYAGTFGMVLGGTVGGLLAKSTKTLRNDMDSTLVRETDEITESRQAVTTEQNFNLTANDDEIIKAANKWGKQRKVNEKRASSRTQQIAEAASLSDYTTLMKSPSAVVQRMAYDLLEGGTGLLGRTRSASMMKDLYERRMLSRGIIPLNENYATWAKDRGIGFSQRNFFSKGLDEFYREVRLFQEHVYNGRPQTGAHPSVEAAAKALDDMTGEALDIAQKSGMDSMQGLSKTPGYIPLKWDGTKMLGSINRFGSQRVTDAITQAYVRAGIEVDVAGPIAKAVINRAKNRSVGLETDLHNMIDTGQIDDLRKLLTEGGADTQVVDDLLAKIKARDEGRGPGYAKARTRIDLTTSDGELHLLDMVDNDLNTLMSRYARDIAGRSGLATRGIRSDADWDRLIQAARKDVGNKGGDAIGTVEKLQDVKTYFTASPLAGGVNRNARRAQQFTTLTALGGVGFAQLAEVGNIIGQNGFKHFFNNSADMKALFNGVANKQLSGDVLDEFRPILGDFDYDHLLYRPDVVLDDAVEAGSTVGTFGRMVDKGLGKGSVALGYASGMNSVRHMEHRLAMKMAINKVAGYAKRGMGKLSDAEKARMADIGLSGAELGRIMSLITKHGKYDEAGTLVELSIAKWPPDLAEGFAIGLNRSVGQTVQRAFAGESNTWMHKTLGSLLTQFRHFPITAFEKQSLRNLRHADSTAAAVLAYGLAWSGMISIMRTGITHWNNPEQLKKRLTVEKVAKDAGNYWAAASLGPDVLTLTGQTLGIDMINFRKYGHGSSSRQGEFNVLDYLPAGGTVNRVGQAVALPAKAAFGEASTSDVRGAFGAVPFSTTIFGQNFLNATTAD